ncbi:homoserine O-acetyltransferase MetX [Microlunatus soli]|uniref:Homoserine O-acetyltransferase n=1 Tax=Microlunatus soli TaxID=630515 RepID=A0A1H1WXH1_9ACTN|nr:homoserine O-acetyltransferase [Microlunatus soli]SDT01774.1 homoserine O-acetyltransferase [Microlunatus soli]
MTPLTQDDLPPDAGGWREGDPIGHRRFAAVGTIRLESGQQIPDVRIGYETWGTFDGGNAVLILHALTGDSHVTGPAGPGHPTAGWWDAVVGPGRPIDTDRWYVVAANILGGCQGSTGPSSVAPDGAPWGSRFPELTVRDQVAAEVALADELSIDSWAAVIGGSAGGMRALEWAIEHPQRVQRLLLLASSAQASADQIALSSIQQAAITADQHFAGGDYYLTDHAPNAGLAVARRLAHYSYRSAPEFDQRFGREHQPNRDGGSAPYSVTSYLEHHGVKLARRFDANSYLVLTRAMDSHDVGRGRAGVPAALARITARTAVAGIDSDRLYPLAQQEELAELIPSAGPLAVINSMHGHDGFLIESEQVGRIISDLLGSVVAGR